MAVEGIAQDLSRRPSKSSRSSQSDRSIECDDLLLTCVQHMYRMGLAEEDTYKVHKWLVKHGENVPVFAHHESDSYRQLMINDALAE